MTGGLFQTKEFLFFPLTICPQFHNPPPFFFFVYLPFLGPLLQHMEIPRLGVQLEL